MSIFFQALAQIFFMVFSSPQSPACQQAPKPACAADNVSTFSGKLMLWNDVENQWISVQDPNAESELISSFWFGKDHIYLYDKSHQTRVLASDGMTWSTENPAEAYLEKPVGHKNQVFGIYETDLGTFASILHQGLVFQKEKGKFWRPLPLPEMVRYVHGVTADIKTGTIFLSCPEGIYTSSDMGQNWNHAYMGQQAGNIVFSNGKCTAGTTGGILFSDDLGKSWKKEVMTHFDPFTFEEHIPFFQVSATGKDIMALGGKEGISKRLWISSDQGKTWTVHPADAYVFSLKSVSSLVDHNGVLYCNHKEGISKSLDNGLTWKLVLRHVNDLKLNTRLEIHQVGQQLFVAEVSDGC